jgi:hypothetical protein
MTGEISIDAGHADHQECGGTSLHLKMKLWVDAEKRILALPTVASMIRQANEALA